ncbi:hypothetical protein RR46_00957 [Papilio xuthus]|uniref:Uncharacterized protein n=1 Tax=Papilio xuthus TaxID=66420 RepID=A0A0N0P9R3_PAPXU|nr:hypothetical protein RR46_00957 [Papilio xuthus]
MKSCDTNRTLPDTAVGHRKGGSARQQQTGSTRRSAARPRVSAADCRHLQKHLSASLRLESSYHSYIMTLALQPLSSAYPQPWAHHSASLNKDVQPGEDVRA